MQRKIVHIDMDAFFASVEQRDHPELKGKPVAVGGESNRGVIAAASYEARRYGVRSAMSSVLAKKKCPSLIIVKPHFQVYKEVSQQIQSIFFEYTHLVEPLSLDEAYLDVTENKKGIEIATTIAMEIKARIREETGLTASAGISMNKFLAKTASSYHKPDGYFVIKPNMAEAFVEELPIEKFFGIGKVTAEKMRNMGIHFGRDLKKIPLEQLVRLFGKSGAFYYNIARAIDHRPVDPNRIRKSIGTEITFNEDLNDKAILITELQKIESELIHRIQRTQARGRTITLKIKFDNYEVHTRSKSSPHFFTIAEIHSTTLELLTSIEPINRGIRLLGLTLSNLENTEDRDAFQLEIEFGDEFIP